MVIKLLNFYAAFISITLFISINSNAEQLNHSLQVQYNHQGHRGQTHLPKTTQTKGVSHTKIRVSLQWRLWHRQVA